MSTTLTGNERLLASGQDISTRDIANLVPSGVLTATIALSNAAILGLKASPVLVLPAPGPGNTFLIFNAVYNLSFVTSAFTTDVSTGMYIGSVTSANNLETYLDQLLLVTSSVGINTGAIQAFKVPLVNLPIYIGVTGSSPSGGGGSVILTLAYQIVSV